MSRSLCRLFSLCFSLLAYSVFLYAYPTGWSDDILISPDSVGPRDNPLVDTDSDCNVWVVYDSLCWGGGYVYCSKRDDMGHCIFPETQISTTGHSAFSRICIDDTDNIHVTWREATAQGYGVGYTKLANDGSVIIPARLAVAGAGVMAITCDMAIDNDKDLHIVWGESPQGYDQITYTLLDSVGDTIIGHVQVSTPQEQSAYYPGIDVDAVGNNHITYRSYTGGSYRLVYTKLDKYGNLIVPNKIIDADGRSSRVVCDGGQNVHIFYGRQNGSIRSIFYLKLDNDGNELIAPTCLSIAPYAENCACDAEIDNAQNIHVVWDAAPNVIWNRIMYTKIDTAGNTIVPTMEIVFPPHTPSLRDAEIAADNRDKLHVVWIDCRPDNTVSHIYYKRGENDYGVEEKRSYAKNYGSTASILNGPLLLPDGKKCRVFDITGRVVIPDKIKPGIYFIEVEGRITKKIVKVK